MSSTVIAEISDFEDLHLLHFWASGLDEARRPRRSRVVLVAQLHASVRSVHSCLSFSGSVIRRVERNAELSIRQRMLVEDERRLLLADLVVPGDVVHGWVETLPLCCLVRDVERRGSEAAAALETENERFKLEIKYIDNQLELKSQLKTFGTSSEI